jgi:hypothetical protein
LSLFSIKTCLKTNSVSNALLKPWKLKCIDYQY